MDKTPPVPQPRRHITANDESRKSTYENVKIDFINKNIDINNDNLQSNRKSKIQQNKSFLLPNTTTAATPSTSTPSTTSTTPKTSTTNTDDNFCKYLLSEMNNLNMDKNKNIATKSIPETNRINNLNDVAVNHPVPAPRRVASNTTKNVETHEEIYANSGNENASTPVYVPPKSPSSTGAISKISNVSRKAPETPPSSSKHATKQYSPMTNNNSGEKLNDFYVAPQLEKSKSNTSVNSSNSGHSSKYSNPSPG